MDEAQKKVLGKLQALCSRRECCSADIRSKALKALEGDAARASEVLDALVNDGYVDDLRFATAFARDKAHLGGWGPVKIRFALSGKGIGREVIDAALAEVDPEASSGKLQSLLAAKARTLEGDPQARLKLIRFALSRGYEYSEIQPYL